MWGEVGRVNDAANTRARWDRTPKQLRVTVIMQAKLPSMVYVHVCVCVCCVDVRLCMCIVPHTLKWRCTDACSHTNADIRECEKDSE